VTTHLIDRMTADAEPNSERLLRRIRAEFLEMPGLCLTSSRRNASGPWSRARVRRGSTH